MESHKNKSFRAEIINFIKAIILHILVKPLYSLSEVILDSFMVVLVSVALRYGNKVKLETTLCRKNV